MSNITNEDIHHEIVRKNETGWQSELRIKCGWDDTTILIIQTLDFKFTRGKHVCPSEDQKKYWERTGTPEEKIKITMCLSMNGPAELNEHDWKIIECQIKRAKDKLVRFVEYYEKDQR